jgi:hypothetical protein
MALDVAQVLGQRPNSASKEERFWPSPVTSVGR